MTEAIVRVDYVTKYYDAVHALKDISLDLAEGEVLGLFGHNGAGKSTLMKLILGLAAPSAGQVLALGLSPRANRSHHYRRQFGYLPENVSFYDQLSGRDVLRYFARLKGVAKHEAERLLEDVGLSYAAHRAVKTYSKGMRQRLGLAQALLATPKLLLLDEPTVGLDPIAIGEFYATIDRLRGAGSAVILCSHALSGVEAHIDRAMILSRGRQTALGTLDELRQEAQLPVAIDARGLSVETLDKLECYRVAVERITVNNSDRFLVPLAEKLQVVHQMTQDIGLQNLELRSPSLEDLYRHYMGVSEASASTVGEG